MSSTTTQFDSKRPYIYTEVIVSHPIRGRIDLRAIIDTGAPRTEFADVVLAHVGIIESPRRDIPLQRSLQTQKHGKRTLPSLEVCGQTLSNFEVIVSRFEKSWGIAALIGLDFFRMFRITLDYKSEYIIAEPY